MRAFSREERAAVTPGASDATDARAALAIGPANYAGQAYAWSRAVREHTAYDAWSFTYGDGTPTDTFQYPADRFIGPSQWYTSWGRRDRVDAAVAGATHAALDGFERLYGWPQLGSTARDAALLSKRGVRVALVSHGSDTRDPDHHRTRNRHSYFGASDRAYVQKMTSRSARNRAFATSSGLPVYVSTPDLLWDLPEATWLPLAIDVAAWRTDAPVLEGARPRVLHLPSRRVPPTKGTHLVTPAMERLAADGIIEYVEPEQVPHAKMPAVIAGADVIIDQITGDAYGAAGAEAMAAGRLVLAGLHGTRDKMPEPPPLVDVDPDTLADVVRDIAAYPEHYRGQAMAGPAFVQRWHDGRASAQALTPFLASAA